MSGYEPSQQLRNALAVFLDAVRAEPFPGETGEDGLDPASAKAIAVLRACGRAAAPPVVSRVEPDPDIVRPYTFPSLDGQISTSENVPTYVPEPAPEAPAPPAPIKDEQPARPIAPPPPPVVPPTIARAVVLKNARAGEAYDDRLSIDSARDVRLVDAGGSGLDFDEGGQRFSGTPTDAGDFELTLTGLIGDRPTEIVAKLAIIPDPKSLWTSEPSDENAPFWKPDEDFQHVDGDGLRMIGASKRGRSHAKGGGFREDDFSLTVHGSWHIAAVADGAGSAGFSRRGSRIAVETVAQALPALLDAHLGDDLTAILDDNETVRRRLYESLVKAAFATVMAIEEQAAALGEPAASLSTTLIVAVARRLDQGWFVAAFSVGDGGAALLDLEAGRVVPLTSPDSGEFAGQTRFLAKAEFTDYAEVTRRLHWTRADGFTALALMSDGITDPKLPTDTVFADIHAWRRLWTDDLCAAIDFAGDADRVRAQFLGWLDFWSPGNHDDRTLAVLLPKDS